MKLPCTRILFALALGVGACAEQNLDGFEDDAAISGNEDVTVPADDVVSADDTFVLPADDVAVAPKDDVVAPADDVAVSAPDAAVSAPDAAVSAPDAAVSAPDVLSPRPDVPSPRPDVVTTTDVPRTDAGGGCAAGQALCAARCVTTATDPANCGACGTACSGATPACVAGRCAAPACGMGASDCDGNAANGCELSHMGAATCTAAPNLGSWCGDTSCGFLCPGTSSRTVATRTGTASAWFRGRTNECSNCPARLQVVFNLAVPAGADYDLFVYSACGGALLGSSRALAGMPDQVTLNPSDDILGSDSFDWWVEVRYFSGGSCSPWTLTVQTRSSGNSC